VVKYRQHDCSIKQLRV